MACDCKVPPLVMLPSCRDECAKKAKDDDGEGLSGFEKLISILGVVLPAVPGVIAATKGQYTQPPVAAFPTSGNPYGNPYGETPTERAAREAREAAAAKDNAGIPKWVYGVGIGFVLLVVAVFAFRAFANKGAK